MGKFNVYVKNGPNHQLVGEFAYHDTVLTVKQIYYGKINDSVPVNQLRFQYRSFEMENGKTLGYYNEDVPRLGLCILLLGRLIGGPKNYIVYQGREYYYGQTLQVWDTKLNPPKYKAAIITEITDACIKVHWKRYGSEWDETIWKNDFDTRLKDFREDNDSKMDDIKENNNDSNTNYVNQNTSNNTGGNKKADTRVNVRKIRNKSFKIGQEVQVNRAAMKSESWPDAILNGLMKRFGWKNFCKGRIVGFEINKSTGEQGIVVALVGYENFEATIWEGTFDFYLQNMGNYIPSDAISKKPIGLPNLRNTCYFNSASQCLMSIPQLNQYIINLNEYPKYGIISSLKELYNKGNGNSVYKIINQCSTLDSNIGSRRQYDSVVAFNIVKQLLDRELMNDNFKMISTIQKEEIRNNPNDEDRSLSITSELYKKLVSQQSKVRELMFGIDVSRYTCLKCNAEVNLYKAFGSIVLPLESANIEINIYPIISRNKQDPWLQCGKPVKMKIRGKYKIKNLKENILVKGNINNDNNKYNISIYSLNLSNKVSKWITYYNDDDFCERFKNENTVFAQIGIENDKRIDVECFDIIYDTNNKKLIKNDVNNNVQCSVWKVFQNNKGIKGKKLYDNFGKKHSRYKLYIFHNNNFVLNESTVKVSNKSVLIFIWLNDINASANDVPIHGIVGSDNLKDIQDAKTKVLECINSKYPIIRKHTKSKSLMKECEEIDKILKVYKLRDNVIKLCKNTKKIKFNKAKAKNVQDCLRIYEEIIPDNGLPCDVCDRISLTMTKQVCVTKTPKVLLLEIDRDADDETNGRGYGRRYGGYSSYGKSFNDVNIIYPINGLQFKDSIYNLYAISVHSGYSTSFGHYVSYVRREVNGETLWYNCNDSSISKIDNPMNKLQSNSAKLLVYIKQDNK